MNNVNGTSALELQDALAGAYEIPEAEEARQSFRINDVDQAGWGIRNLAKIADKEREINAQADIEIARIEAWRKSRLQALEPDKAFFTGLLADYHMRLLEADPKAKTIRLPHGTLQMRAQQPDFKRDDAQLLPFLKADPTRAESFVRVKEEPDWAKLKPVLTLGPEGKVLTADGEIVPGVVYENRPPKFSVDLGKEA